MHFTETGKTHSLSSKLLLLTFTMLIMTGCFEVKDDAPPAKPSSGTIQGKLLDSVTQQAIVGAIVNMGGATATTDAEGKYVIRDVIIPLDGTNNIKSVTYKLTLDLRNVTSPVNMVNTSITPRYPDFTYDYTAILFTTATVTSTTTPLSYLKENVNFNVGKQAANLAGLVADKTTLQAVAAVYTVKLISLGTTAGPGSTGVTESTVGSTLTDANGNFTFSNIESLKSFRIESWNSAQTIRGTLNVAAPVDGATKTLSVLNNNAVLVTSVDTSAPIIVRVTPEMNADIAPAATDVVYTFSKPILQTANTSTSPSVATGLYYKVDVNFNGAKASNIQRSLSWNSTYTQLTINIASLAAASKYTVDLTPANSLLKDTSGTALDNTLDKRVLNFTTNGSITPAAPGAITVTNSASLNYNSPTVLLDWQPVSGAKGYNVYRAKNYPGAAGQLQLVGTTLSTLTSDYSDTLPVALFLEGQRKLTYTYVVTSVSADNIESAVSPSVTAQDNVAPTASIPTGLASTYTITFTEPVDEASAVNLSRYQLTQSDGSTVGVPTVTSAILNVGLTTVTITLNAITLTGNALAVTGVTDISGNVMIAVVRDF